ncbi:MAG: hypothetical protein GX561_15175 [Lentisphaerae bacterium]|jgi:hypothetical protein|nr:hypothetical protein [Lentisphaerota bacterium]
MKAILLILAITAILVNAQPRSGQGHILCSDQKTSDVLIMDANADWSTPQAILWQWNPKDDKAVKPEQVRAYRNPSDAKTVLDGTHVLVVASGGGVALVNIESKTALFQCFPGGNPHSAELLPDGTIITASSHGNNLKIYSRTDDGTAIRKENKIELRDAHGVVWDSTLNLVWAIGAELLNAYRYNFDKDNPDLILVQSFSPKPRPYYGHDLVFIPPNRLLTTGVDIQEFDTFLTRFSPIAKLGSVKSVSINPIDNSTIIQKPSEQWWNQSIIELEGKKRIWTKPGARFYKARWF